MKELTKAEESVMQSLWKLNRGFLKDIIEQHPDPKPAYTTVATVVNVLVKKGMIEFETHGKVREYFPKISQAQYKKFTFKGLLRRFFDDSPRQFASFFASENDLSTEELETIQELINQEIEKKKS